MKNMIRNHKKPISTKSVYLRVEQDVDLLENRKVSKDIDKQESVVYDRLIGKSIESNKLVNRYSGRLIDKPVFITIIAVVRPINRKTDF